MLALNLVILKKEILKEAREINAQDNPSLADLR